MNIYLLIYQKSSEAGEKRFREYLSRKKWFRYTTGVYWRLQSEEINKEEIWKNCQEKYYFDPTQDFFAIFDCADGFRGGNAHYYSKKAPPWPRDLEALEEDSPPAP